jgi:tetratricopeptide (TPR) repeat protein
MRTRAVLTLIPLALTVSVTLCASDSHALGSGKKTPEEEAAEQVKKAERKYNDGVDKMANAEKHLVKGDTTKARKDFEKAARKYSEAIDLHPDFPEALNNLAYSLRLTGRYDEALIHYDRAIELRPDFVQAHEYRARAYLAMDMVKEAKGEYEWLLEQGETEEAGALKESINRWVMAKADGRRVSVEKSGW